MASEENNIINTTVSVPLNAKKPTLLVPQQFLPIEKERIENIGVPENLNKANKRIVKIGFNLIAVDALDERANTFHCNFLLHLSYDIQGDETWKPWIQWKNALEIEEIENLGAKQHIVPPSKGNEEVKNSKKIIENRHMIGTFARRMDLTSYPFDLQQISIVLVSNDEKEIVLEPSSSDAIKANYEYDVLQEWDLVRTKDLEDYITNDEREIELLKSGWNFPALRYFSFKSAESTLSSQGKVYSNFSFTILLKRKPWAVIHSTIVPTTLLGGFCLSVFGLRDLEDDQTLGNRLAVSFTIILTLVATQITVRERLPRAPRNTFIDWYLLSMQLTCYFTVIETIVISALKSDHDLETLKQVDLLGTYIVLALFILTLFGFTFWACVLMKKQTFLIQKARELHEKS